MRRISLRKIAISVAATILLSSSANPALAQWKEMCQAIANEAARAVQQRNNGVTLAAKITEFSELFPEGISQNGLFNTGEIRKNVIQMAKDIWDRPGITPANAYYLYIARCTWPNLNN